MKIINSILLIIILLILNNINTQNELQPTTNTQPWTVDGGNVIINQQPDEPLLNLIRVINSNLTIENIILDFELNLVSEAIVCDDTSVLTIIDSEIINIKEVGIKCDNINIINSKIIASPNINRCILGGTYCQVTNTGTTNDGDDNTVDSTASASIAIQSVNGIQGQIINSEIGNFYRNLYITTDRIIDNNDLIIPMSERNFTLKNVKFYNDVDSNNNAGVVELLPNSRNVIFDHCVFNNLTFESLIISNVNSNNIYIENSIFRDTHRAIDTNTNTIISIDQANYNLDNELYTTYIDIVNNTFIDSSVTLNSVSYLTINNNQFTSHSGKLYCEDCKHAIVQNNLFDLPLCSGIVFTYSNNFISYEEDELSDYSDYFFGNVGNDENFFLQFLAVTQKPICVLKSVTYAPMAFTVIVTLLVAAFIISFALPCMVFKAFRRRRKNTYDDNGLSYEDFEDDNPMPPPPMKPKKNKPTVESHVEESVESETFYDDAESTVTEEAIVHGNTSKKSKVKNKKNATTKEMPLPPPPKKKSNNSSNKNGTQLKVKHNYQAQSADELSLVKGEIVTGFKLVQGDGWWLGENESGHKGLFPANYVKKYQPKVPKKAAGAAAAGGAAAAASSSAAAPPKPRMNKKSNNNEISIRTSSDVPLPPPSKKPKNLAIAPTNVKRSNASSIDNNNLPAKPPKPKKPRKPSYLARHFNPNNTPLPPPKKKSSSAGGGGGAKAAAAGGGAKAGGGGAPRRANRTPIANMRYTLFAHNLSYAAGIFGVVFGLISFIWDGQRVSASNTELELLRTNFGISIYAIALGAALYLYEYNYGLKRTKSPGNVPLRGMLMIMAALPLFTSDVLLVMACTLIIAGLMHVIADAEGESGNVAWYPSSYVLWFEKEKDSEKNKYDEYGNKESWLTKQRKSGKVGELLLYFIYLLVNFILAIEALVRWINIVGACDAAALCPSPLAPFAKMFGQLLNFNCSLLLVPVIRVLLAKANNTELLLLGRIVGSTKPLSLAAFLPLRKNIIIHKIIAIVILMSVVGHVCVHYINFALSSEATRETFGVLPWITGVVITVSMVVIYSGAQNRVKRAHYEIFFTSHHCFLLFFMGLLCHGPVFWAWSFLPISLYVVERVSRIQRGNKKFLLKEVYYQKPVMELKFFPKNHADFKFKEGQYLYVCVPYISKDEWHPFTISSAHYDLKSNDEVTLHIRVQGKDEDIAWTCNKQNCNNQILTGEFCSLHQSNNKLKTCSTSGCPNFAVTNNKCIVHEGGSWTKRVLHYYSMLGNPNDIDGRDASFKFKFNHFEIENKQTVFKKGKRLGPDGFPLIKIDGPHSAPAQHYDEYNEAMIVGAGIGLTPASSIIKATLREKWKKGFLPKKLHFYWIVRYTEVNSFTWFIKLLHELERQLASDRIGKQIDSNQLIDINIYVTSTPKDGNTKAEEDKMPSYSRKLDKLEGAGYDVDIGFKPKELHLAILRAKAPSNKQHEIQYLDPESGKVPKNKLGDIYIWAGRPDWANIFRKVKETRADESKEIGVCFCGTPIVGKDLKTHCRNFTSPSENMTFTLHKENF